MADTLGNQTDKDILAYTNDVVRKADKAAKEIQRQMVPMAIGASPVQAVFHTHAGGKQYYSSQVSPWRCAGLYTARLPKNSSRDILKAAGL